MSSGSRKTGILTRLMIASAELNSALQRGSNAWANFTGGLLASALNEEELAAVTLALYDRSHTPRPGTAGLREWEADWYSAALPEAPAKILVAAAGGGREVHALREAGYHVDAFEPSPAAFRQLADNAAHSTSIVSGATYEAWVEAVHSARHGADSVDASGPIAHIAATTYDAVILGWGSLSHIMSARQRAAIWAAADLTTGGPILASFYMQHRHVAGRGERFGRSLGEPIGRLRNLERRQGAVKFAHWGGFSEPLTFDEVEAVATSLERGTSWGLRTQWPYVTFHPRAKP